MIFVGVFGFVKNDLREIQARINKYLFLVKLGLTEDDDCLILSFSNPN